MNRPRKPRSVFDPPPDKTYHIRRPHGIKGSEIQYIMKPKGLNYCRPRENPEINADLHEVLIDFGFAQTNYDSNVYVLDNHLGK